MRKKKKKKTAEFKEFIDKSKQVKYEDHKALHGIISKASFDFVHTINDQTVQHLGIEWLNNIAQNKRLWKKHHSLRDCLHLGQGKAIIGIGAGKSLDNNFDQVCDLINWDGRKDWEDRDFISIVCNHQLKPMLERGCIPDFVLLVDAGDKVYHQLCKDIPKIAKGVTLITGLQCSPKVLSAWSKQGREIAFYISPAKALLEEFTRVTGKKAKFHQIELGGNVLNGCWMIGMAVFQSNLFLGVGNDLSFEIKEEDKDTQDAYYSDGDYSTNAPKTGSGRDEAKSKRRWGGYSMTKNPFFAEGITKASDRYNINLDIVGTSYTLWVYKTWLETAIVNLGTNAPGAHYFNCSEGGILGVMAKDNNPDAFEKIDNWFMLDERCKYYHTAMFEDAVKTVLKSREVLKCHAYNAPAAAGLVL